MSDRDEYIFPPELYYDATTHVWVRDGGDSVTIGLDVIALELFGDIAYISLSNTGTIVKRGQPIGTIEAAKMVDDLIAPVSGTIASHNEQVLRDPSTINGDAYGGGWLLTFTPSVWEHESAELVHGAQLATWIEAEVEKFGQ
jgi:glycine cleavage system H protein